jgi:hypothetical protein
MKNCIASKQNVYYDFDYKDTIDTESIIKNQKVVIAEWYGDWRKSVDI